MEIFFHKYHGTGNDFIILDNRDHRYEKLTASAICGLCDRRTGIGADGLLMLESAEGYDFRMLYFNADGKPGSMCGNGGRCLVAFAYEIGIQQQHYRFIASDGPHAAERLEDGRIRLHMIDVTGITASSGATVMNTGSPHYVQFVEDVSLINVFDAGRTVRYSPAFADQGINVNFVARTKKGITIRTYERGVEDETYSCGTGATACAIASTHENGHHAVSVQVKGGELEVEFTRINKETISDVRLIGPATHVFTGTTSIYV
ncbi:MAG: diaminopimelate epimerase [Bacteroidota bacterium]